MNEYKFFVVSLWSDAPLITGQLTNTLVSATLGFSVMINIRNLEQGTISPPFAR